MMFDELQAAFRSGFTSVALPQSVIYDPDVGHVGVDGVGWYADTVDLSGEEPIGVWINRAIGLGHKAAMFLARIAPVRYRGCLDPDTHAHAHVEGVSLRYRPPLCRFSTTHHLTWSFIARRGDN